MSRPSAPSEQAIGVFLVLLSALGYAWLPIFVKWAYADGLEPVDVLTLRFAIATPTIWLMTWRDTPDAGTLPRLKLLVLGGLFVFVAMTAFFSLALIPSSLYTLLLYTYPAMVVLLAWMQGEKLSSQAVVALVLTVAGVALTVPLDGEALRTVDYRGVGLGLLNAALYAIYIVFSQRLIAKQKAVAHATRWSISGSLVVITLITLGRGLTLPLSWVGWASAAGIALICTILPIFTFLAGMKRLGAANASILSSIEPLATLILAAVLLGETLSWQQMAGGGLILLSVIVLQWRR